MEKRYKHKTIGIRKGTCSLLQYVIILEQTKLMYIADESININVCMSVI